MIVALYLLLKTALYVAKFGKRKDYLLQSKHQQEGRVLRLVLFIQN